MESILVWCLSAPRARDPKRLSPGDRRRTGMQNENMMLVGFRVFAYARFVRMRIHTALCVRLAMLAQLAGNCTYPRHATQTASRSTWPESLWWCCSREALIASLGAIDANTDAWSAESTFRSSTKLPWRSTLGRIAGSGELRDFLSPPFQDFWKAKLMDRLVEPTGSCYCKLWARSSCLIQR